MKAENMFIVLGGTGPIGNTLKKRFESNNHLFILLGRKNTEYNSIMNGDFQKYLLKWRSKARQIILIIACGGNYTSNISLAKKLRESHLDSFNRVILFSSLTAENCDEIQNIRLLDQRKDKYGKRYLEISLINRLDPNKLVILRLGRVVNADTIWDKALCLGAQRRLGLPKNCIGQITDICAIFQYLNTSETGLFRLYYKLTWPHTCHRSTAVISYYLYGIIGTLFKNKIAGFRFYKIALDK
jgi:hypothetical protein